MASPSFDPRIKPKPAKPPVPVVADAPVEMPPPPAYPKELLSDSAFWSVFREWYESWESFDDHCDDLIDAGEHVISVVTRRGRGRASGAEATTRRAGVWTIRDGRIVRAVWFPSVEEAREAAGLAA